MPLIDCKVELSLKWYEECILSNAGTDATFTITDAKLYVPIVTLKIEDNTKLTKLLNNGFKRSIYWSKYKVIFKNYNNKYIRERIDASFQGVNKLFVLPYAGDDNITDENPYKKYFLPRIKIANYKSRLTEEIFMISQLMIQSNNTMKLERYQQEKVMIQYRFFVRFSLF